MIHWEFISRSTFRFIRAFCDRCSCEHKLNNPYGRFRCHGESHVVPDKIKHEWGQWRPAGVDFDPATVHKFSIHTLPDKGFSGEVEYERSVPGEV